MTNEQALGRALALLTAIASMSNSYDIIDYCAESEVDIELKPEFERLVRDIDKFLDSEFRRER